MAKKRTRKRKKKVAPEAAPAPSTESVIREPDEAAAEMVAEAPRASRAPRGPLPTGVREFVNKGYIYLGRDSQAAYLEGPGGVYQVLPTGRVIHVGKRLSDELLKRIS
jgi:hypothetical protein